MCEEEKTDGERIVEALGSIGVSVGSVWDLLTWRGLPNRETAEVLLQLLPQVSDLKAREGIIRSLATRDARGTDAIAVLIAELDSLKTRPPKELEWLGWVLGDAISRIGELRDETHYEDLVRLLQDKNLGKARQMLADAVAKTKHPGAVRVLLDALDDEDLTGHAIFALGQLRDPEPRAAIEPFLRHQNKWFRKEARRALSKIDKAARDSNERNQGIREE